ncbi:hypothetical protein ABG977_05145 [Collinsella aerofaciens]
MEQSETGAADNLGGSMTGDIDTSEIGNESIKNDSDLANPIAPQVEPRVSLASDMSTDSEQATKAAISGYQYSDSATSGSVTLTVEWNDPVLGQPTTFHVSATGGSGSYLFRMDAPSYSNSNEYAYESVADPSRGEWTKYTDACVSHGFTFTTTATGSYNFRFYLMDKASGVYYLRTNSYIQVADDAYPALRALSIKQCHKPSKRQMILNTKWLSIFTTGLSISLSTTTRSRGPRLKVLLRGGLGRVKPMNQRMRNYFLPQA